MRISISRASVAASAVLLGIALLSGSAEAKRPVGATPAAPPPPPPAPVETSAPAAPAAAATPAAAPAAKDAKPAPPPKPVDFADAPNNRAGPAAAPKPAGKPTEIRYGRRVAEFQYSFSVRPAAPKPGDTVEVVWRINEMLPIPDPAFGDRKPFTGAKLVATVAGPQPERLYEVHALQAPGTFGMHFTAGASGVYKIAVDRADGRRGMRAEFPVGVGVPMPGLERAGKAVRPGEDEVELVHGATMDDATAAGVMAELGRRWIELEKTAGTPAAAKAAAKVHAQAKKLAGKAPDAHKPNGMEFDQLANLLVEKTAGLEAKAADRTATLTGMRSVQDDVCLRCHTRFRFDLAESVSGWPDFMRKQKLEPAAPAPAATTRGRRPLGAK